MPGVVFTVRDAGVGARGKRRATYCFRLHLAQSPRRLVYVSPLPRVSFRTISRARNQHLRVAIFAQHDVLRSLMSRWMMPAACCRKCFRHLHADLQNRIERQRFFIPEMLPQGLAVDQFGRDIVLCLPRRSHRQSECSGD